jgi:S-adenosylmethionine:tRNA ribosyltransferase-isomerase
MKTARFSYDVPDALVPRLPSELRGERRDDARMLVLERASGRIAHGRMRELGDFLRPGDLLVVNDTRVLHDRLDGACGGRPVSLLLYGRRGADWHVRVTPAGAAAAGATVAFGQGVSATLLEPGVDGLWVARFEHPGDFACVLQTLAVRDPDIFQLPEGDDEVYQTVFAARPGSLDIPAAGLHFTPELVDDVRRRGVEMAAITLHIGLSSASPQVQAEEVEQHRVGEEWYEVTEEAAAAVNAARARGARVVAVGTTVVRTLESAAIAQQAGERDGRWVPLAPASGWTDLYIYPGHAFRAIDGLVTNMHAPRSSHLLMTSALAGTELTLRAYDEALERGYRFYEFGDCMVIL